MTLKPLTWARKGLVLRGSIGAIELFSVRREAGAYALLTFLPWTETETHATSEECQAAAPRMFERFLATITEP